MEFLRSFLIRRHFTGKPMVTSQNVSCFYRLSNYRSFSHDVRQLYLGKKQSNGDHVCVQKKNPVGIELFSHVKTFFYSKQFAKLTTTCLKTIYSFSYTSGFLHYSL